MIELNRFNLFLRNPQQIQITFLFFCFCFCFSKEATFGNTIIGPQSEWIGSKIMY